MSEKIQMIKCPLCGRAMCSSVRFICVNECLNYEKNCLQDKDDDYCKCSRVEVKEYFVNNYNLSRELKLKEMIKIISRKRSEHGKVKTLSDDLFLI